MSDPGMSMPPTGPNGEQISEEELRQYLSQLRGAPVSALFAQAAQMLLEAAQVKLGRKDARLLIDTIAQMAAGAAPYLDEGLAGQLKDVVAQLQQGQVQAENEIQQARAAGQLSEADDPNDLASYDGLAGGGEGGASATPAAPAQPSAASRLWTPGA